MIIERFSKAGRQVWLTTNGIRIPEPLFSSIIDNARGVLLSLVGSNTESYLQTARYDGFEKAMNTLKNLSIAKKQSQSPIELNVTHVFNEPSIDGLEDLVLCLNDLGINEFRLRYDYFHLR
jgi:molybdenum cofactor biosynthesis enzyme MoaA